MINNRFVFLIPALTFFVIFGLLPVFLGFGLSFTSWDLINPMSFVGLSNFRKLLEDKWFWNSLIISFKFTGITTPMVFILSLVLALLLYKERKTSKILRAFFYWSYMTPVVVAATMWKWLLSQNTGFVNYALSLLGIKPVSWLNNSVTALLSVCAAQVWILSGFMMVLFITGLQNIPSEYREAALVDGANKIQIFRYVTFPLLKNTNILVLVLSIAYSFRSFTLVYIMTTGGPGYATTVTPLYIYQTAFTQFRIGYASSMSLIFLLIVMSIAFLAIRFQKKEEV
jgi:alpha-1,4-digalacturonate transport system permease protein